MDSTVLLERRLRSHRLTAPAATPVDAATHLLAVQAQDFAGGRWALGVRTRGATTLSAVDAAFDRGLLVRSWTMRGTLHIVPARDLGWLLAVTAERQHRGAAGVHRREGIDADELRRAERLALGALAGGGRLTRDELFGVLSAGGVDTAGQRGYHLLVALSLRAGIVLGPVVPKAGGLSREQYVVRADEWLPDAAAPAEPVAEMFVRYVAGHGPADVRDFAWWSGLPLTVARAAAEAAGDRVRVVSEHPLPLYVATGAAPRRSPSAPQLIALPPFDEYYLSYADRTRACAPEDAARVGPGSNGMVRAVLLERGVVAGTWLPGRSAEGSGAAQAFRPVDAGQLDAALARHRAFVTG
ncbi:winged helix DNA-binding domain-containing protein [Microbacterium sp. NPDC091313]